MYIINVHIRFRIVGTIESPIPELVFLTMFIACHEKQALFVRVYGSIREKKKIIKQPLMPL